MCSLPICNIFCISQILVQALKESLVSARTPLVAAAAQNTASVLPSKHVLVQKNEDVFSRRPLLCFVRGRKSLFGAWPHFCCTICHNSSSHVFPLMLSGQLFFLSLITLVLYVQRAYRFGCSLTGWVVVIHNVQGVSSKSFSEKGFCINAE